MSDQAELLRKLAKQKQAPVAVAEGTSPCEIVAVTSGKGGVGKSNITLNVSIVLARKGAKVLILDADIGTANIDILVGMGQRMHLGDVFDGKASLFEIIEKIDENLYLVPGASGIAGLNEMPYDKREALRRDLLRIDEAFDYLIIDTSAGINTDILHLMAGSDRVLLICNNEPTAVVDAYALCKTYYQSGAEGVIELIANNVADEAEADEVFEKISSAMGHFLKKELKYLGHVVHDEDVALGVINQKPVMMTSSDGPAVRNFQELADLLYHQGRWEQGKGIQQLFNHLVSE
ncbi:MAG: AAA family ATPase [Acidobacteriota bacterium]|nr:AAA family ATPase [Acidobacteriota bacterium]